MNNSLKINKILKNFFLFSFGSWISAILGIVSLPIITRLFDPNEFGSFNIFIIYANILFSIMLLGLDQALVRYYYDRDINGRSHLLGTSIGISILFSVILFIPIIIGSNRISNLLFSGNVYYIYLLPICVFTLLFNRYSSLILRMENESVKFSLFQIINKGSYVVFVLILWLVVGNTSFSIIFAFIISLIISAIYGIYEKSKIWVGISIKNRGKANLIELLSFGVPVSFTLIINWIFQSMDKLFIQHYINIESVGIYSSAVTLIGILSIVQVSFSTYWFPLALDIYKNQRGKSKEFYEMVNNTISFLMYILCVVIICSKEILIFFLGEDYREASTLLPLLVFAPCINTIAEVSGIGITLSKKTYYNIYVSLIAVIINLIGNLLLIPSFGLIGAAISSALTYIGFYWAKTLYSQKHYKFINKYKNHLMSQLIIFIYGLSISIIKVSDWLIVIVGILCLFIIMFLFRETASIIKLKMFNLIGTRKKFIRRFYD